MVFIKNKIKCGEEMSYRVPFIDYSKQYHNIKAEIDEAYFRCMENGDFIFRQDTVDFENNLANLVGKKHGISCDSCTNAMFLSLVSYGIGRGDEVITVDHTYIATIDAIIHAGAKPVLIDVCEDFNMNTELIEQAITPRTKAIIPVHLNGRSCQSDKIIEIANKHNLKIIEDNAQSLGASYKNIKTGSFGDTSCYSLYPAKILGSYGDGGCICTDDDKLAKELYRLRDHGENPSYLRDKSVHGNDIKFWGYNSLLDNLQAAFLNVKLKHLNEYIERRRGIASMYEKDLFGVGDLALPYPPNDGDYFDVYQNYVVLSKKRNALSIFLDESGVETLIKWYPANYKMSGLKEIYNKFYLPVTDMISQECLSLPMYPELDDWQVEYVISKVREFFGE